VGYNIPELLQSRKAHDIGLVATVVLLGITSFGLGRLSVVDEGHASVALCASPQLLHATQAIPETTSSQTTTITPTTQGQVVGSKNGTVYHLPWCSGAKRISENNKVWFVSKTEAEAAGYRPAANCKGI